MTTEQKLDQELDLIEDTMAAIKKMLEWPVTSHTTRETMDTALSTMPLMSPTNEAIPGCCAPEVATTASRQ